MNPYEQYDTNNPVYNQNNSAYQDQNSVPYFNENSKTYAQDTYAQLIKNQYSDYRDRFMPYEKRLMSLSDSTKLLDEQLGRITTNVNKSYDAIGQQQNIMNQRFGLTQSVAQQKSNSRSTDINRALSMANAKNNTRIAAYDTQNNILTGASAPQQNFNNMASGG